jgi:hypothetical protein
LSYAARRKQAAHQYSTAHWQARQAAPEAAPAGSASANCYAALTSAGAHCSLSRPGQARDVPAAGRRVRPALAGKGRLAPASWQATAVTTSPMARKVRPLPLRPTPALTLRHIPGQSTPSRLQRPLGPRPPGRNHPGWQRSAFSQLTLGRTGCAKLGPPRRASLGSARTGSRAAIPRHWGYGRFRIRQGRHRAPRLAFAGRHGSGHGAVRWD